MYSLIWWLVMLRTGYVSSLNFETNQPLPPVAHDRQTALTQRKKCAARARRQSLGLRPCFVRLAPAHSHPDCRCCLTLIGARQHALARRAQAHDDPAAHA